MDLSDFTPAERKGIRRVIRRMWWRRLWNTITGERR